MTFAPDQLYCILDYETYSEADLKKVGAYEYAVHPSTDILCVAWKVGTRATLLIEETKSWAPALNGTTLGGPLAELAHALSNQGIIIVAHNALFEQLITRHVFKRLYATGLPPLPPEQFICTAALAAAVALPRALGEVCDALNLSIQKDAEGRKLMLKYSKPRKPTKKDPSTRHTDLEGLRRVVKYCVTDIDAETLVFLKCPPLIPIERDVWLLDQRINLRGFLVDRPLVLKTLEMIRVETERLNAETVAGTDGQLTSGNQRNAMLEWLKAEGVELANLQKKTIEDALKGGNVTGLAKTILEFRQAVSKTSTAKYVAFELRSRHDGRLRDILKYHAASPGRWGGVGVQPQNFPRGTLKNPVLAAAIMEYGDLELIRMLYGEPMEVFSSALRCMIVAPKGKVLDVADYAAIEARVLAWVSGDEPALTAFREGRPIYEEQAAKIFDKPVSEIKPGSYERFVGKESVLGMGYQMGWERFQKAVFDKGHTITDELAERSVDTYRSEHPAVVECWDLLNRAAIAAVENLGKSYTVCRTKWFVRAGFLWCILPSGRRLAYPQPTVEWAGRWLVVIEGKRHWSNSSTDLAEKFPGHKPEYVARKTLCYYGVNKFFQWAKERTYGGKLTENVVQAIARDLMAAAMLRIEATGIWELVLSVHDELLGERFEFEGSGEEFNRLMAELPPWAVGCPVKVEHWTGTRYRK